jgi:hypothetical protein
MRRPPRRFLRPFTAPRAPCLQGVRIGVAMAGVRKANRRDLVVFELAEGSSGGRGLHQQPLLRRPGAGVP